MHTAPIEFTTLVMPDGRLVPVKTAANLGLNSIYSSRPPKRQNVGASQPQDTGVLGTGKQKVQDAIQGQIDRARSIPELMRGPDKREKSKITSWPNCPIIRSMSARERALTPN